MLRAEGIASVTRQHLRRCEERWAGAVAGVWSCGLVRPGVPQPASDGGDNWGEGTGAVGAVGAGAVGWERQTNVGN